VSSLARNKRKIVFVIVEGASEDTALSVILTKLFEPHELYVEITHGDITSDKAIKPESILSAIKSLVECYLRNNHQFRKTDIKEIIHLIDTDGVFVPDSCVVHKPEAEKTIYTPSAIHTADPNGIIRRNHHKQLILSKICGNHMIWKDIPYASYYMSCNLDHVLYDKQNNSDDDKKRDALYFAKRYKNRLEEFLIFISQSGFSVNGTLKESWEFIRKDLHSLERHTNLGLCFDQIETK
jgi:hypothetical protein